MLMHKQGGFGQIRTESVSPVFPSYPKYLQNATFMSPQAILLLFSKQIPLPRLFTLVWLRAGSLWESYLVYWLPPGIRGRSDFSRLPVFFCRLRPEWKGKCPEHLSGLFRLVFWQTDGHALMVFLWLGNIGAKEAIPQGGAKTII